MRVAATTVIRATPDQVWSFITVLENGPRWQESAVWTRVVTPGPIGLGSAAEHEGRWLGLRIHTNGEVAIFDPPVRFGYTIRSKVNPKPVVMRYEIEWYDGGTRLTLSTQGELSRLLKPFHRLLERNVQGMFDRDVARLKAVIEAEEVS